MKIIVFGDSISFGQYVSPHKTWVGQVSVMLEELSNELNHDIEFQCEAVNGRTTRMALETMPQEIQKHSPDIVIVQFGLNDCNYWDSDDGLPRVSRQAFGANITEIINRCLNFACQRVFVNTNHPTTRKEPLKVLPSLTYQRSNEAYSQQIRESVESLNDERVSLIDIEETVNSRIKSESCSVDDFILPPPDALHLSQFGHDHYTQIISQFLFSAVNEIVNFDENS